MNDVDEGFKYVGFFKRFLAYLIDLIIFLPFLPLFNLLLRLSYERRSLLPYLVPLAIAYALLVFLVVKYGGTPGKLLLRLRIVDQKGQYLSIPAALIRMSPLLVASLLYTSALSRTLTLMSSSEIPHSFLEFGAATLKYGGVFQKVSEYWNFLLIVDPVAIFFNQRRRALHDFLAGSFVVSRGWHSRDSA